MSANQLSANLLLQMAKTRRSVHNLSKDIRITSNRILELVNETTLHTPSPFNSQSNRVLVLFGGEHDKLWDITAATLRASISDDKWKQTEDRMAMFKNAAGTVLFFDDQDVVKAVQTALPTYADRSPTWATQSLGMQQFLLWTALELEGLGVNLQHYNPLIDQKVAETWELPQSWKLNAQLVFGQQVGELREKEFKPLEDRVKVFGA